MNDCSHKQTKNNYCINCGIEVQDSIEFVNDTMVPIPQNRNYLKNRYKLHKVYEDKELDRLLEDMNIKEYKYDIIEVLENRLFKQRLSKFDKILITIFFVLKNKSFPVIFMDLERYSKNVKKKYYREFCYNTTDEYLKNVYDRFFSELSGKISDRFPLFYQIYGDLATHRIERVVLAVLLKGRNDIEHIFEEFKLEKYIKYNLLEKLIKKIDFFMKNEEKKKISIRKSNKYISMEEMHVFKLRNELKELGIECKSVKNINKLSFLLRNYTKKGK